MKAKIRGIYTTALTKVLLDHGYEIIHPSLAIKKRFGLSDNPAEPDLKIKDRFDLQGVRAFGTFDAVDAFQSILQSSFEDVLTRKWPVSVDGIYIGKMAESDEYAVYVDLGEGVIGRLPKQEYAAADNKPLLVQVERKRIGTKQPLLTTNLKIVGNLAILTQNSKVGVSLKIHDIDKRAELYVLGKTLAPDNWGIIWRETSATQAKEILEDEITKLVEKAKILSVKARNAEAPSLLAEGSYFIDVEFPYLSKQILDKLRASLAPTLVGHHFYKSCNGRVSAALEMAEKLLEEGQDRAYVEKIFKEQILREFPEEGSQINVEHVKLSGIVFQLGQATIERIDNERIKYSRTIHSNGIYDGLDIKKEAEDTAESETRKGDWFITTKYFSKDGELKGTYINVNTPIEIYPNAIHYVDLEADVCITPEGTMKVLDMEKLEKALEKCFISEKLFQIAQEKVKEITQANTI
jgi:Ribonuclease G/E